MPSKLFYLSLLLVACFLAKSLAEDENDEELDQIIGGSPAMKGQYPYLVFFKSAANKLFCSGTLITPNKVLTTAWCFPTLNAGTTAVMNTLTLTPDADRVIRQVIRVVKAADYNPSTGMHDIAIATLDSFVLATSVSPVVLGFGMAVNLGSSAVTVGWGYTEPTYLTTVLRNSYITIQSSKLCATSLSNSYFSTPYFLCAASPGVGSCSLDAGSPILLNGRQIGISSKSRCGGGEPVVAVDVRSYETWIRSNV